MKDLKDSLNNFDEDEIVGLLIEILGSLKKDDPEHVNVIKFVNKIYENIHQINMENILPDYFASSKIRKNLNILTKLFEKSIHFADLYCSFERFAPQMALINGKSFQVNSCLSFYFSY
jgi:hypothetical protein